MTREFVSMPAFEKSWRELGFGDQDLSELQFCLCRNPELGDMVEGTGGLRKLRFAFRNRGKSRSVRIAYVDFRSYEKLFLIVAFQKSEKVNFSVSEKQQIRTTIQTLKAQLKEKIDREKRV